MKNNNLFGIAAIILSIAVLIHSISDSIAFPQGPNVSLGSNPIVTIRCPSSANLPNIPDSYTVPAGYDYIVTDWTMPNTTSGYSYMYLGNDVLMSYYWSSGTGFSQHASFATGLKIPSGETIRCVTPSNTYGGVISGYLAHQ